LFQERRDLIPLAAFTNFRDAYEPPDREKEGFDEIKEINLVFDAERDEERARYWKMWLEVGGSAERKALNVGRKGG
jgi:hypothetical protein